MKYIEVSVDPGLEDNLDYITKKAIETNKISPEEAKNLHIIKRSLDARNKPYYIVRCSSDEIPLRTVKLQDVHNKKTVHIIGAGPAGLFAALRLIERGIKPIILERGKKVRDRRRDLAALMKQGILNTESNYCFGEGGAGTFSDGKLYTRSGKRGSIAQVLDIFVQFGAEKNITIDAHPHIGTNKLPKIIDSMTRTIESCGGEVHFSTTVCDVEITDKRITKVITNAGTHEVSTLILASGHSARDIFEMLDTHDIAIEAKSFALGVRIEHPQHIINQIQYKKFSSNPHLPPASYALVTQVADRGVYTFCMCPGGIICPASTNNEEIVVNGWSPSTRGSYFANSGLVVEIPVHEIDTISKDTWEKTKSKRENLKGLYFQSAIEQNAYRVGGGKYKAPAQRVVDLLKNKTSDSIPKNSYKPGLTPAHMQEVLPPYIYKRLTEALRHFTKKNPLYGSSDAIVVGVESRTSSPVKIPRNEYGQHIQILNLYPCGEGAGYAGGIVSAAMDGIKIADHINP